MNIKNYLFIDVETRSYADLKAVGAWRYSEHESTDVICIAAAINEKSVICMPPSAWSGTVSDKYENLYFVARNALFEYAIFANVLCKKYGWSKDFLDPARWICTAALSAMHGLPRSLEPCAEYITQKNKKLPDGKRLINLYSKPVKNRKTGELSFRHIPDDDMQKFIEYNIADVETDRECFNTLIKLPNYEIEKEVFQHDFQMNIKGIRIDTAALEKVLNVFDNATKKAETAQERYTIPTNEAKHRQQKIKTSAGALKEALEIVDVLSIAQNYKPLNVRSPKQLKEWLLDKGIRIPDTKIETIETLYDEVEDGAIKEVLALRQFLGKASVKKYRALSDRVSPDGYLRYFLKYFGAHTGRYSGEGFQIHNLPKGKKEKGENPVEKIEELIKTISPEWGYKELIDAGKKILPGLIIPDKNCAFILGDFAAIEARGVAYLSGCKSLLKQFQENDDVYMNTAKYINNANPNRQLGKAVILGCGYGMGVEKFQATCQKWGIDISSDVAEKAVTTYRERYKEVPAFWFALENAFKTCWIHKKDTKAGEFITLQRGSNYIKVRLPSGRFLYYHRIKIENGRLSYFSHSRKARQAVWGGSILENLTQAACRDIMTDRITELEKRKLPVVLHVHDEIVVQPTQNWQESKQVDFDIVTNEPPAWLPGFPLKTESEIVSRYHK